MTEDGDAYDVGAPHEEPAADLGTRRGLVVFLAVAVIATVVAGGLWLMPGRGNPGGPGGEGQPRLGPVTGSDSSPLPDRRFPDLRGGEEIATAAYRGTPLVVNFWATWCAPCIEEMPDFQEVATELEGQVAFLGINVQDNQESALRFADHLQITYDLAVDRAAEYFKEVRGFGMPTTLLVDEDGIVRYRHTGALDAGDLRERLADYLGVDV